MSHRNLVSDLVTDITDTVQ